jgi:hypothetical protein
MIFPFDVWFASVLMFKLVAITAEQPRILPRVAPGWRLQPVGSVVCSAA